jgi:glycosyltransferase involved in cell wall biosynthesis
MTEPQHREADGNKYSVFCHNPPLVSCVMVTGKDAEHYKMAELAIESFSDQLYPNKELIIINDGPQEMNPCKPLVREVRIPYWEDPEKKLSLGALRNIGLDEAKGDWICQWDDDDYSHPTRIVYQMAVRREGACVMLQNQIRYNVLTNTAGHVECTVGHAGTIIHPKEVTHRYPEQGKSEDAVFWVDNWGDNRVVLNNNPGWYPGPALYLRFYHGHNTWDEGHVMREFTQQDYQGGWFIEESEKYFLAETLQKYGLDRKGGK